LISAASAIVVAFICRIPGRTATGERVPRLKASCHGKCIVAMFALAAWVVISPIAIHHDFPGFNTFALPVLTVVVAAIWPVNGWEAAAWMLGLHALNFVAEPIVRMVSPRALDRSHPFAGHTRAYNRRKNHCRKAKPEIHLLGDMSASPVSTG